MSTAPRSRPPSPTEKNPFFYGFRYVETTDERGRIRVTQQPLTEEDVLHPRMEDHVTQNEPHQTDCVNLKNIITDRLINRLDAHVFQDMLFRWGIPGLGDHGPDLAIVLGIRQLRRWDSFDVLAEGVRPELIIEVTSPATRDNDLNVKPQEYWIAGVRYYIIVEERIRRGQRTLRFIGRERGVRRWRTMRLNSQGRLWLPIVELWLGEEQGQVACYDAEGRRLESYTELRETCDQQSQARGLAEQAAEQARQRVEQERRRAEQAEQAAEQERQRAEQERQRAEQEREAAEQERRRAEQAEERARRLEQELRRLRGEK